MWDHCGARPEPAAGLTLVWESQRALPFPSLHSVTSHCQLEIGLSGGIYTMETGKLLQLISPPWRTGCQTLTGKPSGHRYSLDSSQVDVSVVIGDYILNSLKKILEACGINITLS